MRDSVLKQRSDCNRKFHKKSDYPEEFENIWGTRKVSDYPSRKHAGFAVFLIMNKEIKTLKEQLASEIEQREKAENVLRDIITVAVFGRDNFLKIEKLISEYFYEKQDKENKENKE